jgi:hypothetical protein
MFRTRTFALGATLALAAALPLAADHHAAGEAHGHAHAAAGALSDADRATLVAMLEQGQAETAALLAKAEGALFTTKPAADRWSAAEVLEHIAMTEEALFGSVEAALAAPEDPEGAQLIAAQPIANFSATIKDRSQRFQAPDMLRPSGGKTREELVARYEAARAKTLELVRTTQADVVTHTGATPMGKLTVHHFLTLIAAHNLRHNQQMAEAIELAGAAAPAAANASH